MGDDHQPSTFGHSNCDASLLVYRVVRIGNRDTQQITENRHGFMKRNPVFT